MASMRNGRHASLAACFASGCRCLWLVCGTAVRQPLRFACAYLRTSWLLECGADDWYGRWSCRLKHARAHRYIEVFLVRAAFVLMWARAQPGTCDSAECAWAAP